MDPDRFEFSVSVRAPSYREALAKLRGMVGRDENTRICYVTMALDAYAEPERDYEPWGGANAGADE